MSALISPFAAFKTALQGASSSERTLELSNVIRPAGSSTSSQSQNVGQLHELSAGSRQTLDLTTEVVERLDQQDEDELTYPEGGPTAYLVVFGSFMGLIPAFGLLNAVGTIQAYVSSHQLSGLSASTVSWIFSIYTFTTFSSQIFSGAFFDRKGSRRPILIGTVAFCGGLFATANATKMYQFILGFGLVVGFGNGMMTAPLIGVVSHYFKEKRATATSIASIGGSVGGIIISVMLRELYYSVGFQWSMRILSFFTLFCCSFALVFAKERFRQDKEPIESWKSFLKVYFIDVFAVGSFKEARFTFCSLGCAFAESGLVVASIYFSSYSLQRGFSEDVAYFLVPVTNSASIVGRYIPAYLADRYFGRFNTCITSTFISAVLLVGMWIPLGKYEGGLYAFAVVYGFFSGSVQSLTPVCMGQISRTEDFGKRYATMYLLVSSCMLACISIGGAIIGDGSLGRYNAFIAYCAVLYVLGSGSYVIARHVSVGSKLQKF